MRIEPIKMHTRGEFCTWGMRVIWEAAGRSSDEVTWSVLAGDANLVYENAESMLLAVLAPAMLNGEANIFLPTEVDGLLVDSLRTAMFFIRYWYPQPFPENVSFPRLQFADSAVANDVFRTKKIGMFFSGGVDSFYTLQRNIEQYPPGHPDRVSYCIFVHGFDLGWSNEKGDGDALFNEMVRRMRDFCQSHDIRFIPVWSNVRALQPEAELWGQVIHLGAMSSVAHMFSGTMRAVLLASGGEPLNGRLLPEPYGGHPMLVQYLSSRAMMLVPQWPEISRTERVGRILDIAGIENLLHVCFRYWLVNEEVLNCGVCEKCVRTKLNILAVGRSIPAGMFQNPELGPELVNSLYIDEASLAHFYYELQSALHRTECFPEIQQALRCRLEKFEIFWRWRTGHSLGAKARKWFRRLLGRVE